MRLSVLLLALPAAAAAGYLAGAYTPRVAGALLQGERRVRPPVLEQALRALERDDAAARAAAVEAVRAARFERPGDQAWAAWIVATADGDPEALGQLIEAHPGEPAAARALLDRIASAAAADRPGWMRTFGDRHPDAWVLRTARWARWRDEGAR